MLDAVGIGLNNVFISIKVTSLRDEIRLKPFVKIQMHEGIDLIEMPCN